MRHGVKEKSPMNEMIVARREASGMTSVWTEYLCVRLQTDRKLIVFTGRYEGLALASEFYDEESDDFVLPESINGIPVRGVDEECVFGGELTFLNSDEAVEISDANASAVDAWLHQSRWSNVVSLDDVREALQKVQLSSVTT